MTSPSSLGCRPSAPRWSIASTGAARWLRSTDLLPAFGQPKSPGFGRGFFVVWNLLSGFLVLGAAGRRSVALAALRPTRPGWHCTRSIATLAFRAGFRSPTVACGVDKAPGDGRKCHAQTAADRWAARARHRPALDRPGPGCDQLAAIELHDPPDAVGRIRRSAGRARPDSDLAEQALGRSRRMVDSCWPGLSRPFTSRNTSGQKA